jgi:hypothetical protein
MSHAGHATENRVFIQSFHKSNVYIQRHTTPRILAYTNINNTQSWEKSNGRSILPSNQLTTDNFKVLVNFILKKKSVKIKQQDWIPNHQSGFRQTHFTVQQFHRTTDYINKAMENLQ